MKFDARLAQLLRPIGEDILLRVLVGKPNPEMKIIPYQFELDYDPQNTLKGAF